MPNWCENTIRLEGPEPLIREIWETAKRFSEESGNGLLQAIRPMPEALLHDDRPSSGLLALPRWYEWRHEHWGVKWDVPVEGDDDDGLGYHANEDGQVGEISGFFETPWGPPIEVFRWLAEIRPEVTVALGYYESGNSFAGRFRASDGEVTVNDSVNLGEYKRIEEVPAELIHAVPMLVDYFDRLAELEAEEEAGEANHFSPSRGGPSLG